MSKQINVTKLMELTAQSVINIGKAVDIEVSLYNLYNDDQLKHLAFVGGLLRQIVEKNTNEKIEVINK